MTLKDAKSLAVKVLSKTLDMTKLTSEKGIIYNLMFFSFLYVNILVEMATLTRENNKTVINILNSREVEELITDYEKSEAAIEASKKEQKQTA